MTSLAALLRRTKPAAGGVAAAMATALILSGCAGTGPGTETETTTAPETQVSEPTAAPDDRQSVSVVVLAAEYNEGAGTIEVRSIVTDHIGEGTCTITATSTDGATETATAEALPDAQSTVCPTTLVEGLDAGDWSVVVSFESDEAAGESESTPAEAL
ncbi:MAG: hypothetical protein ACTHXA_10095 [Gulosibacter sp.]|uniref:hypothetical protein n=1 Tax=Gulosibacter sp. TaxID=2817531 RepID=UPI003F921057